MRLVIVLLSVVALLCLGGSDARSWRCGSNDISVGDTKDKVIQACGEPAHKDTVSGGAGAEGVLTETWIYRLPGQQPRELTFRGVELTRMRFLDR